MSIKIKEEWKNQEGLYICPVCQKRYTKNGISTHIWRMHGEGNNHKPFKNKITWNKGLTKETDDRVKQQGINFSKAFKEGKIKSRKGTKLSKEICKKISIGMQKVVRDNPESYNSKNVCGRVKNIDYNGFTLKGNWELLVAKFLDSKGIKWTNIVEPFTYIWKGSKHLYFPDFYLLERDEYIEVKGYERPKDVEKWKVVSNLRIIKLKEINNIKNNLYCI